jgi:putative chitinase
LLITSSATRPITSARRIINGTDKAKTIAGHAAVFEAALKAGDYGTRAVVPASGGFWAALGRFLLALIKGGKK